MHLIAVGLLYAIATGSFHVVEGGLVFAAPKRLANYSSSHCPPLTATSMQKSEFTGPLNASYVRASSDICNSNQVLEKYNSSIIDYASLERWTLWSWPG